MHTNDPFLCITLSAGEFIVAELNLFSGILRIESGFSTFMGAISEKKSRR